MSTQQPLSKIISALTFISGAYLFFITLVLAPYINFTVFSSFHTTTKVVLIAIAAIVSAAQLLFALPYIKKGYIRNLGMFLKYGIYVSLFGILMSVVWSASVKTSIFGMFTGWESNVMVFLIYGLLLLSWTTYFLLLKHYQLDKLMFHTLMTMGIIIAIFYSFGEYYLWKPNTGYISQSVARISLGFKNPLFAAYFLGMLWTYSFAQVFENLALKKSTLLDISKTVLGLTLYVGMTYSLIFTFTRSAILMAGLSAALIVILKSLDGAQQRKNIARTLVAFGLLIAITLTIGYGFRKEFSLRNSDLSVESQNTLTTIARSLGKDTEESALNFYQKATQYSSSQIRLLEWKWGIITWSSTYKNILFGTGPDAGFFEMPKHRDSIFNNFPTDSATKPFYIRSLYINALMQFGIVTIVGFILLLIGILNKFRNVVEKDWVAFSLVIGFFAQGIFYYPTHVTVVLLLFGVGYLIANSLETDGPAIRKTNSIEKLLLVISAAAILLWIFPIAKADYIISMYSLTELPFPVEEMKDNANLPINNNVLKRYLVYHYSDNEASTKLLPLLAKSDDVDDLRIAADSYYILARKTNSKEATLSSITVLQKLLTIDATLPATWDGLGLRYLFIGDFINARTSFTKAITLKPDYWYSYMHLGEVSRQQCNPKEALDWYKKAEQYIPTAENEILEANQEIKTPRAECK